MKTVRQRFGRPAEPNPPGLCRRNSLCLPLADIGALVFRYKGQHLQHNVAEESTQQILSPPGVQQGHIQHHNINAFFFGEEPPLLQNFCVVAPQTVDALDAEQIVFFLICAAGVCTAGGRNPCRTACPHKCSSPGRTAPAKRSAACPPSDLCC